LFFSAIFHACADALDNKQKIVFFVFAFFGVKYQ